MTVGKRALRVEALRRRGGLSLRDRDRAEQALVAAVAPLATGRVAAYASVGTEPATGALLEALDDVVLPVLLPDGDLDWALFEGHLAAGPHGLLQPTGPRLGPAAVGDCILLVVPALAVDHTGTRLGRGGGSYDRALARARAPVVAALHVGELVPALPVEPHDRPVHAVVLPDRGLVPLPLTAPGVMFR